MKKKLVVYRTEKDYREKAGSYPCILNFDFHKKRAEFDDGCGNSALIDFLVLGEIDVKAIAPNYDAVEFVGFGG